MVEEKEYESLRNEIKESLLKVADEQLGTKLIDEVKFREEIYEGEQSKYAPDILFKAKDYGILGRQLLGATNWFSLSLKNPNGFHRKNGIFIAYGIPFKKNYHIKDAKIIDIMPTILYSCGIPIPDDLDGKVLDDIFNDAFLSKQDKRFKEADKFVSPSQVEDVYSDEESKKIEEHLKSLGYLE